jgi:hypothetical protein
MKPADDHALYTWDSDLSAPAGRGVPPGAPPALLGMVVPPIPVPGAVHSNAALLAAARQAAQGTGAPTS